MFIGDTVVDIQDLYDKLEEIRKILSYNFFDPSLDTHHIVNHTLEILSQEMVELHIDVPQGHEMFMDSLQINNDPEIFSVVEVDDEIFSDGAGFSRNDVGIPGRSFRPKLAKSHIIIKLLNTSTATKFVGVSIELRLREMK